MNNLRVKLNTYKKYNNLVKNTLGAKPFDYGRYEILKEMRLISENNIYSHVLENPKEFGAGIIHIISNFGQKFINHGSNTNNIALGEKATLFDKLSHENTVLIDELLNKHKEMYPRTHKIREALIFSKRINSHHILPAPKGFLSRIFRSYIVGKNVKNI